MSLNPASNTDPSASELQRRLSECLKARATDWQEWREREQRLKAEQQVLSVTLSSQQATSERLSVELAGLERELAHLQNVEVRLRQESARAKLLEEQVSSLREEVERLFEEQAATSDDLLAAHKREQELRAQVEQLSASLGQARRQLEAASEPDRFVPEGLLQLLRARVELPLTFSPGLSAHLAQPASLPLEITYNLLRLQCGVPWDVLRLSARLEQALDEHRRRGG